MCTLKFEKHCSKVQFLVRVKTAFPSTDELVPIREGRRINDLFDNVTLFG